MDNLQEQDAFYANIEAQHQATASGLAVEAKQLQDMRATPGWGIVERFLGAMIQGHTRKLVKSRDAEEILRLQEHIQAYSGVLSFVEVKIKEGVQPDVVGQLEK